LVGNGFSNDGLQNPVHYLAHQRTVDPGQTEERVGQRHNAEAAFHKRPPRTGAGPLRVGHPQGRIFWIFTSAGNTEPGRTARRVGRPLHHLHEVGAGRSHILGRHRRRFLTGVDPPLGHRCRQEPADTAGSGRWRLEDRELVGRSQSGRGLI